MIAEVSAHAIYLEKLGDIKADVAVLTNVSQDHLDYFKDFVNYQSVKMSYFEDGHARTAVVNVDDESGRILLKRLENKPDVKAVSFGLYNPCRLLCGERRGGYRRSAIRCKSQRRNR